MDGDWIDHELETANLEDKRLNERFGDVLRTLGSRPNVRIPAAYRFFDNEKVLKPHRDAIEK